MRALINKQDNSVSLLERNGVYIPPSWASNTSVYLVDFDASCLEGIEEQFMSLLFYDPDKNTVYRNSELFVVDTEYGRSVLEAEVRRIALLPVEARTSELLTVLDVARDILPQGMVDEILADDVLSDAEIADIMGYLNAED